jgi:hypothetical protein
LTSRGHPVADIAAGRAHASLPANTDATCG